ncbi:hypothetical protein LguiA_011238 [Lonicera macranthoides]
MVRNVNRLKQRGRAQPHRKDSQKRGASIKPKTGRERSPLATSIYIITIYFLSLEKLCN